MCSDPMTPRARSHPARALRRARGMSLIELMAGLVVAMLVALAAMSSANLFNASQRQGVGMGSSNVAVAGALSAIKHDVAQAGLGFFGESRYLCNNLNLAQGSTIYANNTPFAPVMIIREASGSDALIVVHADAMEAGSNVRLAGSTNGTGTAQLRSFLPLPAVLPVTGTAVLLSPAPPGINPDGTRAVDREDTLCTVRSVTAVTPANGALGTPLTLTFGGGGIHNQMGFTTQPTYLQNDRITLLGNQLTFSVYRVDGERNLVVDQPLNNINGVILARNVMAFRAQFGVSSLRDANSLEDFIDAGTDGFAATPTSANLDRVRALRLGIVTRSTEKEKAQTPGNDATCAASTTRPTLFPASADDVITPDVTTSWRCYRYRTTTAVVPLRNLVQGQD